VDLGLHLLVLWRFRLLIVLGTLLALTLMTLSLMRVTIEDGKPKLTYRESEVYVSVSKFQVTQAGFPEGRSVFPQSALPPTARSIPFADPSRFTQLAFYYSQLANSDDVRRMVYQQGPLNATVLAQPVASPFDRGDILPFIAFSGSAADPATAQEAARRGAAAFMRFLSDRQRGARIPEDERVLLKQIEEPQLGTLVAERRKTRPIAIFLAVMIAFVGLAFILENLRPRVKAVTVVDDPGERSASRRIA
jgi:hypothetical protein